jgi:hypothetical protein
VSVVFAVGLLSDSSTPFTLKAHHGIRNQHPGSKTGLTAVDPGLAAENVKLPVPKNE